MGTLLINKNPILVLPALAVQVGVNEAIVLQLIHNWLVKSSHVKEGRTWIFNTYKDWQAQLPFWSESTIKRAVKSLEKKGLLLTECWNKGEYDHTKWYTINYEKLTLTAIKNGQTTTEQTLLQLDLQSETN